MRRNGRQWLLGKTFDTFCPLGPAIVTREGVPGGTVEGWGQDTDGMRSRLGWDGNSFSAATGAITPHVPHSPLFFPKVGSWWHCHGGHVPPCHLPQTSTTCGSAAVLMGNGCRTATPATSSLGCPPSSAGCPGRKGGGVGTPKAQGAMADTSYAPRFVTLVPGDILLTGTPAGVGVFQKPPVFLKVRGNGGSGGAGV